MSQRIAVVVRSFTFDAAHTLPWHSGKCSKLHGHTYRLEVAVRGVLNDNGIVVDFDDLGAIVQEGVLEELDHSFLNDIVENPTAEEIAFFALERLMAKGLQVDHLRLWETSACFAEVRP